MDVAETDDLELSLMNGEERARAAEGFDDPSVGEKKSKQLSSKDKRAMVLLVILCQSPRLRLPLTNTPSKT